MSKRSLATSLLPVEGLAKDRLGVSLRESVMD
jgi:hypothetical protein